MWLMGQLSSQLLKAPDQSKLDLDFVLEMAKKATEDGESRGPVAWSALARAFEAKQDWAAAIKVWSRILELDLSSFDKNSVKARLDKLKREKQ